MAALFENDSVLLTKRPRRWRNVQFQRSTRLVCPSLLPTALCRLSGKTFSGSSPKSRCRVSLDDSFQGCAPTASGNSARRGCQWRKQLPGEFVGTAPPRSTACMSAGTQTTTSHPAPEPLPEPRREPAFASEVSTLGLFLSQRVRVLRETPKMRLMPRREVRSW